MMAKRDCSKPKERSTSFRAASCIAAKCLFFCPCGWEIFWINVVHWGYIPYFKKIN
jgi:hypothetical protein